MPALAEVEAIAAMTDPVVRNLRITQCYAGLSRAFAAALPDGANWCTFATWASKQAGRSIRAEDIAVALEARLKKAPGLNDVFQQLKAVLGLDRESIIKEVARLALRMGGIQRSSTAVAEGNVKVFAEIGREFARSLEVIGSGGTEAAWGHFLGSMRGGDPPEGQSLLVQAFGHYRKALSDEGALRAERILTANLLVGYHEQTRLQPEIQRALDEALLPHAVLEQHAYDAISSKLGWLPRIWSWFSPTREMLLRKAAKVVAAEVVKLARMVATEQMMSIEFPGGLQLKLGQDVQRPFPASLAEAHLPELRELLRRVDPTPDSRLGSGARDWADFAERMHFITDLFRAWQEETVLFGDPFSAAQVAEIGLGRRPAGDL
ncbi:MAG: hypothetical protein J0L64_00730 [Acidobacteria bacterium]|nr:hypothetical protein [Acidobacteriota bacterium]